MGGLVVLVEVFSSTEPEPRTLLEGVISRREQIPPSRLHIRWTFQMGTVHHEREYLVLFDGELRFFLKTNSLDKVRTMYDGRDAFIFHEDSVIVRDLDTQAAERLFDPRALGLTDYTWAETPQLCLDPNRGKVRLVGFEQINDKTCAHVQQDNESWKQDVWIDPENDFAVLQLERSGPAGNMRYRSVYQNPVYPWLPSRVEEISFKSDGLVRGRLTVEVLEAKTLEHIPPETWTLSGLLQGLTFSNPVMVTDVRKGEFIGTWDGQRLIPYHAAAPRPNAPPFSPRRVLVLLVLAGLVIFPLALLWLRKRKPSRQTGGGVSG